MNQVVGRYLQRRWRTFHCRPPRAPFARSPDDDADEITQAAVDVDDERSD
jgi:hypothetical protein